MFIYQMGTGRLISWVAFQRLSWFPRSNPKRSRLAWADIRHALFQGICPEAKNPRYREMADSALIFPMGHIRCMVGPTLDPTLLLFELQPAIATIAAMIQAAWLDGMTVSPHCGTGRGG